MPRKKEVWEPHADTLAHMPEISGNTVNGLGEKESRRPSPFFWHAPEYQSFGEMQAYTLGLMHGLEDSAAISRAFALTRSGEFEQRGPAPVEVASNRAVKPANEWSRLVKEFALAHDADVVGIAEMEPEWIYEGFEVRERFVVVLGVAHDYTEMSQAPSLPGNNRAIVEVGKQYTRAAAAASHLLNFIREQGYPATAHPGPMAKDMLMIPAAIAAGLGELGKHGSLINRRLGSSFRLSAVTTDLPVMPDAPDVFGGDEFCTRCQVCSNACPPDAIFADKQWVRGVEKWYVDFDKCIPYFAESRGCGICIVVCPWSRPGVADNLLVKMARRKNSEPASDE